MPKVKTFFHVFIYSMLPQEPYYAKLLHTPFSFSLKYFITITIFLHILFHIFVIATPRWYSSDLAVPAAALTSLESYPRDLTVIIKNGQVVTNYDRPFFLWIERNSKVEPFLVIDTTGSAKNIDQYNSMALLTARHLTVRKETGEQYILPLNTLNLNINKTWVESFVIKARTFLWVLIFFYVSVWTVILMLFKNIVFILIASLISFFLWQFSAKKPAFKKIVQMGFHTITFPLLTYYGLSFIYPAVALPGSMFLITFLIFLNGGIYEGYLNYRNPHRKTKSRV